MTDHINFTQEVNTDTGHITAYRFTCNKCEWTWRTKHFDHHEAVARLKDHHAKDHPMTSDPVDPFTVMAAAAVNIHEMYVSLLAAGFTAEHAIYLTAQFTTGGKGTPPATPAAP